MQRELEVENSSWKEKCTVLEKEGNEEINAWGTKCEASEKQLIKCKQKFWVAEVQAKDLSEKLNEWGKKNDNENPGLRKIINCKIREKEAVAKTVVKVIREKENLARNTVDEKKCVVVF